MSKFLITVKKEGRSKKYDLYFQYNQQFIETVKSLDREFREFDKEKKCWRLNTKGLYLLILKFKGLDTVFFDFGGEENRCKFLEDLKKVKEDDDKLLQRLKENEEKKIKSIEFKDYLETNYLEFSDIVHKNLKEGIKLFPHQIKGVMFCKHVKNSLLAHQMGLGKTLVSISYSELCNFDKVVVITPNSLKFNYYNEVCKFTNSRAYVYNSKNNKYTPDECKYIIFNYEMLNPSDIKKVIKKFKLLKIENIDCVILDECQLIKNSSSNTFKNFDSLFREKLFKNGEVSKIFMSGTPAPNRVYELYPILHQISPLDFKTKESFYSDYCGMTYNFDGFGYNTDISATNFEILFQKMKPFVDRRRKSDELDLPEKTYQKVILELDSDQQNEYNKLFNRIVFEFLSARKISRMEMDIKVRKYLSLLKFEYLTSVIDSIIESGNKVVIIDKFKECLNKIKEKYGNLALLHTGDITDIDERNRLIVDFQNPNGIGKIFLGSVDTCNYGLTLTAADTLIVLTPPDSLGKFDQVCDRIHRIGQTKKVTIICPVFVGTIDEKIYDSLDEKREELSIAIDNEKAESLYDTCVLDDIIKNMIVNESINVENIGINE